MLEKDRLLRSPGFRILAGGVLILLLVLATAPRPALPGSGGPAEDPPLKLRVVELAGTPYQMGKTHGQVLRTEIRELVERWKKDLARTYRVTSDVFIRAFLEQTDFKPAIDRWTPGLLDEVRGIADGAGVDFDTMYAFQLIDEVWTVGPDLRFPKCTSVAAGKRNGQPAVVAQTLDIPTFYHGFQTVLRIRDERDGLETLVFTIPGVISANGLNSRSVGVCVNAVTQLAYSPEGLPVAFVIRGILRQRTYEEAVKFLEAIRPAAPQTYVIGGPKEAAVFERSAGRMTRFVPFAGAAFSYHTNHPMVNDDFNPKFPELLKRNNLTWESYQARCPRFKYLGELLKDNSAATDLDALKAIFTNRGSGINNEDTYGCTIMLLGEKPELHISPGRPDEAKFQVLGFTPRAGR
jgi:isopenicillin-N N-acyltransferase-like protein